MAKSFGEALATGVPIVMTGENKIPEVLLRAGKEKEALETLEKMGIIKIVIVPDKPQEVIPLKGGYKATRIF